MSHQSNILTKNYAKIKYIIKLVIYRNATSFCLDEYPTFQAMIMAAINVSKDFDFRGREHLRGPLLDSTHKIHMISVRDLFLNNDVTFGIHFLGDGSHITVPLFNIFSSSAY